MSAGCENPGNEYGRPGSKEVYLPGVKIPGLSMGAREGRSVSAGCENLGNEYGSPGSEDVYLPGV